MNEEVVLLAIFAPIFVFTHFFIYNIQSISSKNYFYGVFVGSINLDEDYKKNINSSYKKNINILFLIVLLTFILSIILFNISIAFMFTFEIILYSVFSIYFLRKYYIKVITLKKDLLKNTDEVVEKQKYKISIDTELINKKCKLKKKFTFFFSICLSFSVLSLLYLLCNYNNLPDTIPTHWNLYGEADAFSEKNIKNVFFFSFIDILYVLLLAIITIESIGSKSNIDIKYIENNREKYIIYLNRVGYSFLIMTLSMQLITTTNPIFIVKNTNIPMIFILQALFIPIITSIFLIYNYLKLDSLLLRGNLGFSEDDEKWLYGFIYFNNEDPSAMVRNRFGSGWSVNLGSTRGKLIILITILITLFPFILI